MTLQLEVCNLSYTYPAPFLGADEIEVLQGLSFEIKSSEFVVVFGPSGCGKTTLLNLIAAFVPCQAGEIVICGAKKKAPNSDCVLISQEQNLFEWKTTLENVAFGLKARGLSRHEQVGKAMHYLSLVNLADFAQQYPKQLSAGMKQRLGLARALAVEPQLLLMDEPFASLDWQARLKLQDELLRVCEATKQTVLMTTHDIAESIYLADRVMVMTPRPGRIAELIPIPISRPRISNQRYQQEFLALERRLLGQLAPNRD